MLKKLFIIFLVTLFLPLGLAFAKAPSPIPTPTPTKEVEYDFSKMTTYEMFWPVVAGKVPGDRFYSLKVWRDNFLGYLYVSPLKKSEYFKQLANKRLLEAEKLLEIGRTSYFSQTLQQSSDYLEKGLNLLFSAPESQSQFWLRGEYEKDLQKHLVVLERMKEKGEENQKAVVEESIGKINNLIKKQKF